MNFMQRAVNYVRRRVTKSILLAITFFVIGNLVILGVGISQAADNAKVLTRKQMRAAVNYEVDYEAYWKELEKLSEDEVNEKIKNSPKLSEEVADEIMQDKRIKTANYMSNHVMYSIDFENVKLGNKAEEHHTNIESDDGEAGARFDYRPPNISVYAIKVPNTIEIAEKTWKIKEGRFLTQEDMDAAKPVICVTEELATVNNFKLGDRIKISEVDTSFKEESKNYIEDMSVLDYEAEIVGIYTTDKTVDPNTEGFQWMDPFQSPKNIIVTPFSAMANYIETIRNVTLDYYKAQSPSWSESDEALYGNQKLEISNITFLLNDPLEVDRFVEDYQPKMTSYTKLNANNEVFKKLARPLDTLSFFASIIVWIVVINAIVIISLVTALTLKTREFEIGVLLSVGVSKFKILSQLFLELMIVAFIGFTLAVISGSMIAGKVGKAVLEYQTATDAQYGPVIEEPRYSYFDQSDYFSTVTQEDLISQYEVKVSPLLIGEIYVMGTVLVLIAIIVPAFMIMRLNPKQILLEQN